MDRTEYVYVHHPRITDITEP